MSASLRRAKSKICRLFYCAPSGRCCALLDASESEEFRNLWRSCRAAPKTPRRVKRFSFRAANAEEPQTPKKENETELGREPTFAHEVTVMNNSSRSILVLLAFVCPPLAVLVVLGCDFHVFTSFVLTLVGWFPGVAHAIFIVHNRTCAPTPHKIIGFEPYLPEMIP
ncbi:hypothetical protein L596_019441 [Steinernema carpocapsae]|uniref:Uncharacterized protein n=1 Tax=Steinernema carpocapsae TaxID=34508 RepID=A0A4U5MQL9_STECR|nr:hypothetical protein L596_019441 [Steinernema carpocapsae]